MGQPTYDQILKVDTRIDLPATAAEMQLALIKDTKTTLYFSVSDNAWMPLGRVIVMTSNAVINALNQGAVTTLFTLPESPMKFRPTQIIPKLVAQTALVTPPNISVGSNATAYNNIASSTALSNLLSVLGAGTGIPQMVTASPSLSGGTSVSAKVNGVALAGSYQLSYDMLGYYSLT